MVILVDDGIATGATVKAGYLYLKTLKPKKIILAIPVAPVEFDTRGMDETIILVKDPHFSAVSQYYQSFPQVTDDEVKEILRR